MLLAAMARSFAPVSKLSRRRLIISAAAAPFALSACASLKRLSSEPSAMESEVTPEVAGCAHPTAEIGPCRFLVARDTVDMAEEGERSLRKEMAHLGVHRGRLPPADFLAVSGGGDDGAFGAGLLVGWTEAGTRPEFKAVTGVSTGALTAPFAFLGSRYDADLKAVYTEVDQRDIFKRRGPLAALFSDALSDTTPLYRLVQHYVSRAMLDEIAAEYAKGRLLLVGTSNLDTLEPVIWNMTAIAANRDPQAERLFHKILLASAAIPGAFPPVMIDMHAGERRYQEMHVDGGAMAQVFAYPPSIRINEAAQNLGVERERKLYVIRNAPMTTEWANTRRATLPIAGRAVGSLMTTQGIGDLYRIFMVTQRDGVDFNLAYIPRTFQAPHRGEFNTEYMRALFKTGHDMAVAGYPWQKVPPGYEAPRLRSRP
jgi:hypothetical protein